MRIWGVELFHMGQLWWESASLEPAGCQSNSQQGLFRSSRCKESKPTLWPHQVFGALLADTSRTITSMVDQEGTVQLQWGFHTKKPQSWTGCTSLPPSGLHGVLSLTFQDLGALLREWALRASRKARVTDRWFSGLGWFPCRSHSPITEQVFIYAFLTEQPFRYSHIDVSQIQAGWSWEYARRNSHVTRMQR